MLDQRETAASGQGRDGGKWGNAICSTNNTLRTAPDQETLIVAALAEINRARHVAASCRTAPLRATWKRYADDVATWVADDVLKARHRAHPEPPGRRVPPATDDLRVMVDHQRKIETARLIVELWATALPVVREPADVERVNLAYLAARADLARVMVRA